MLGTMQPGHIFTIEPMINEGTHDNKVPVFLCRVVKDVLILPLLNLLVSFFYIFVTEPCLKKAPTTIGFLFCLLLASQTYFDSPLLSISPFPPSTFWQYKYLWQIFYGFFVLICILVFAGIYRCMNLTGAEIWVVSHWQRPNIDVSK